MDEDEGDSKKERKVELEDVEMDDKFAYERQAIEGRLQTIISRSNQAESRKELSGRICAQKFTYKHGVLTPPVWVIIHAKST